MQRHEWVKEFSGAVTVCDTEGVILEMNDRANRMFKEQGGSSLVGSNVFDCHPEPARTKLRDIMNLKKTNVYTIEKKGLKKMIYQTPWYLDGQYRGFVEIVLEFPESIPHFIRE
jgi:transcriptional regulator with PAS, ATPase and Fis domain